VVSAFGVEPAHPLGYGCARVRRRALWVRKLQGLLGGPVGVVGDLLRGRWTPGPTATQGPLVSSVSSLLAGGARVVGGGLLSVSGSTEPGKLFLRVVTPHGVQRTVCPDLLGKLAAYAWMRPRDGVLLEALRSRARDWCKLKELPEFVVPWVVSGTVTSVMLGTVLDEASAYEMESAGLSLLPAS